MQKENKEIFDYLVSMDLDINELNNENQTPLIYAVKLNMNYYVSCLLKHNADTSIPDDYGCTPLLCSVQNNNFSIAKSLLEAGSPTSSPKYELSPLYVAIQHKFIPLVYLLIQFGASPNLNNGESYLLQESVQTNSVDIFKCLLANGATGKGFSPNSVPSDFKLIYDQWSTAPIEDESLNAPLEDYERQVNDLNEEYSQLYLKIKNFVAKAPNLNFDNQLITPILNTQNGIISTFSAFVKKLHNLGRTVFKKRLSFIDVQFDALSSSEKKHIEELFNEDESQWYKLLELSKALMHADMKIFDPSSIADIENQIQAFPNKRQTVIGEKQKVEGDDLNRARHQLAFLNVVLEKFDSLANLALGGFKELKGAVFIVLNKAIDALNSFKQTLVDIRQTSFDIALSKPDGEGEDNDARIESICSTQCDKIQVDITFVEWQREQFTSLSILLERCLRMCIQ